MKSYLNTPEMSTFFERVDKKSEVLQYLLKKNNSPAMVVLNDTNFQTKIKCHLKNCSEVADTIIQKEIREEWEQRKQRLVSLANDIDFNLYLERNAKG